MAGKHLLGAASAAVLAACQPDAPPRNESEAPASSDVELSLTRLDCGSITIKNFDKFFSDRPGLYESAPREITDSCYLIRHGDRQMLWDTGVVAARKGKTTDLGELIARLDRTLAEQLADLGLKPADIDVVGISHAHSDHTGQAAQFGQARLVVGKADFEQSAGEEDPFRPWRGEGKPVTLATGDIDIFGDGSVMALHLPGHTPDHLALLVRLPSGPVLLSGDLYHSIDAREKRGVPPFNTDREQTLRSMDRFEKLARDTGAKVVIQHEPRDIAKLPTFPAAAE